MLLLKPLLSNDSYVVLHFMLPVQQTLPIVIFFIK